MDRWKLLDVPLEAREKPSSPATNICSLAGLQVVGKLTSTSEPSISLADADDADGDPKDQASQFFVGPELSWPWLPNSAASHPVPQR